MTRGAVGAAVAILIGATLASFLLSTGWVDLVRDTFHFRCDYLSDGESSGWMCADGIGYVGAFVVIVGMQTVLLVAAIVVALHLSRRRMWRALPALGIGPAVIFGAVLLLAGGELSDLTAGQRAGLGCLAVVAAVGAAATAIGPRLAALPVLVIGSVAAVAAGTLFPSIVALSVVAVALTAAAGVVMPRREPA